MPPQNRVGLNHAGQPEQAWPEPRHPDDEDPVTITQPQAVWRAPKGNIEPVPKKKFSISSCCRDLNKLATNVPSKWRMASITPDDAMILRDRANPPGWNFRERQPSQAARK